ncbi:MAG: hypothetical protein ABIF12_01770 [bacterium]
MLEYSYFSDIYSFAMVIYTCFSWKEESFYDYFFCKYKPNTKSRKFKIKCRNFFKRNYGGTYNDFERYYLRRMNDGWRPALYIAEYFEFINSIIFDCWQPEESNRPNAREIVKRLDDIIISFN